jgi:hypothetical protein
MVGVVDCWLGTRRSTARERKVRIGTRDEGYGRLTSGLFSEVVLDRAWRGQKDVVFRLGVDSDLLAATTESAKESFESSLWTHAT